MAAAAGPDNRTMAMAPCPGAVARAAIVSSRRSAKIVSGGGLA